MKPGIIVIAGPTASGKTALGVEIAERYNGEVISADSMQVYKGMDIATAKPTREEMKGIPHHLIDFVERTESFSVADYVPLAAARADDIISRGKIPVIVGGTGLYITSFMNNVSFPEISGDENIRNFLRKQAAENGNAYLFEKLMKADPETAAQLHENDLSRVVRALEVFEVTGRKISEYKSESMLNESPYSFVSFVLSYTDRQVLYDRINKRVDIMLENGLLDEAYQIFHESSGIRTAQQAIGCKELFPYFENTASLEECTEKLKQETRRYAKKQLTWFRKQLEMNWLEAENESSFNFFIKNCEKIIAKSKII